MFVAGLGVWFEAWMHRKRTTPLGRVKVKFTIKFFVYGSGRLSHTVVI